MSGVWSSTWRLIGIGLRAPCPQSILKVQYLQQNRPFCKSLELLTLHIKPGSCLSTHLRYAHSLSGSRNSKSGNLAKANKRAQRPNQFNFSAREIQLIFEGALGRKDGNQLLQTLQKQRVSGTLDQEVDAPPHDIFVALEWLRINIPVDEDRAIIARLEREEREDDAKAEKIRSYTPQKDAHKTGLYGPSRFDEIRKINKQKAAEKAAQLEKAMMEDPGTKELQAQNTPGGALITRKRPDWIVRYREAATMQGKMPPSMSKFERLWASALVTFVVVGLSIVFAQNYIPPSRRARIWPDLPPAAATLMVLIGINVAISFAWRLPPLWKFMNRNFIVTSAYPYARGIIGSMFSHQSPVHLAVNMVFLWAAGTRC